jgi:general secretion pathway protein L
MAKIDLAREQVSGSHRLLSLLYQDNRYRLEWQANDRDTLEALQSALQKQALQVKWDQVERNEAGFNAILTIPLESS